MSHVWLYVWNWEWMFCESFLVICLIMACFVMLAKYTGDCRLHTGFCCPLEIWNPWMLSLVCLMYFQGFWDMWPILFCSLRCVAWLFAALCSWICLQRDQGCMVRVCSSLLWMFQLAWSTSFSSVFSLFWMEQGLWIFLGFLVHYFIPNCRKDV